MSPVPAPIAAGLRRHEVVIQSLAPVADGDGGFTEAPTTIATVRASIETASQRQLERVTSGTVIAEATHLVTTPYVSGVTTQCRVLFGARTFQVLAVTDPLEAHYTLQMTCMEIVL